MPNSIQPQPNPLAIQTAPAEKLSEASSADTMFVDMHVHSHFSDGTFTPEQIGVIARQVGLHAVALTDHDTIDGCHLMTKACAKHGLEFIPATELTSDCHGTEVHMLGYYIDVGNERLAAALARAQTARQNRVRQMIRRLNLLGIPLAAETVLGLANCSSPGRPHIARALVQAGVCASYEEAFERFLGKNKPAWVPNQRMPAKEAIALVHAAGGFAVLAHPGLNEAESAMPSLIEAGLDGIECYHSIHSPAQTERFLRLAARHGLLVTGGSDCHGDTKGAPLIGTVKVSYGVIESMKSRKQVEPRNC